MPNMRTLNGRSSELRKAWDTPHLVVYGDMTVLTQQACNPNQPNCKPKVLGLGDDFSNNISTLGGHPTD